MSRITRPYYEEFVYPSKIKTEADSIESNKNHR